MMISTKPRPATPTRAPKAGWGKRLWATVALAAGLWLNKPEAHAHEPTTAAAAGVSAESQEPTSEQLAYEDTKSMGLALPYTDARQRPFRLAYEGIIIWDNDFSPTLGLDPSYRGLRGNDFIFNTNIETVDVSFPVWQGLRLVLGWQKLESESGFAQEPFVYETHESVMGEKRVLVGAGRTFTRGRNELYVEIDGGIPYSARWQLNRTEGIDLENDMLAPGERFLPSERRSLTDERNLLVAVKAALRRDDQRLYVSHPLNDPLLPTMLLADLAIPIVPWWVYPARANSGLHLAAHLLRPYLQAPTTEPQFEHALYLRAHAVGEVPIWTPTRWLAFYGRAGGDYTMRRNGVWTPTLGVGRTDSVPGYTHPGAPGKNVNWSRATPLVGAGVTGYNAVSVNVDYDSVIGTYMVTVLVAVEMDLDRGLGPLSNHQRLNGFTLTNSVLRRNTGETGEFRWLDRFAATMGFDMESHKLPWAHGYPP